jgi:hypothetical protein
MILVFSVTYNSTVWYIYIFFTLLLVQSDFRFHYVSVELHQIHVTFEIELRMTYILE